MFRIITHSLFVLGAIGFAQLPNPVLAYTSSVVGQYKIMTEVPHTDADEIHAMQNQVWSPIHVDCYYHLGHVYYDSIWVKKDGTEREIFTGWGWWDVYDRLDGNAPLNELLQVDACTVPGNYPIKNLAVPNATTEALFSGIWVKSPPSPTLFAYVEMGHLPEVLQDAESMGFHEKNLSNVVYDYGDTSPPEYWIGIQQAGYSVKADMAVVLFEKNR